MFLHTGALSPGLISDLLWSDPEKGQKGWGPNDRGVSYTVSLCASMSPYRAPSSTHPPSLTVLVVRPQFGADVVEAFLKKHELHVIWSVLICIFQECNKPFLRLTDTFASLCSRGHQVVEDGYEFFANRSLVTLFSAPN